MQHLSFSMMPRCLNNVVFDDASLPCEVSTSVSASRRFGTNECCRSILTGAPFVDGGEHKCIIVGGQYSRGNASDVMP